MGSTMLAAPSLPSAGRGGAAESAPSCWIMCGTFTACWTGCNTGKEAAAQAACRAWLGCLHNSVSRLLLKAAFRDPRRAFIACRIALGAGLTWMLPASA